MAHRGSEAASGEDRDVGPRRKVTEVLNRVGDHVLDPDWRWRLCSERRTIARIRRDGLCRELSRCRQGGARDTSGYEHAAGAASNSSVAHQIPEVEAKAKGRPARRGLRV